MVDTQKVTEMYHVPGRYAALFGYERTPMYPFGHRNIIHPDRNVPAVRLFFRPDNPERYLGSSTAAQDLVDNDTELLYEAVRETGGITIPHTSASVHGTDWRSNDRAVEPVVEIYQGLRASSEHDGAPAAVPDDGRLAGTMPRFQPAGFVWKAWEKGHRLGVIASSDHNSTHLSYAMVYSGDSSGKGLLEAIRQRHTYAATDNIIVEFRMGEHLMGDDFTASAVPDMKIYIRGTAPIETLSIIRNQSYIAQQSPKTREVSITFRDADPLPDTSYYYIRAEQSDGNIAWSSPIWVTVQ